MIDTTRKQDLERIAEMRKTNPDARRVLERAYKTSNDRTVTDMRQTLIDAHRSRDVEKAEKIEREIKKYEYSKYGPSR